MTFETAVVVAMVVIQGILGLAYGLGGDTPRMVYWASAASIALSTLFMK